MHAFWKRETTLCLISEFVSLGEQMLQYVFKKKYFVQVLKFVFVNVWIIMFFLSLKCIHFWCFEHLYVCSMCPVINSSVMKDMLLIYLIIFKYNITCTAMILVYVLYQYYLMLLYHFIYTFNRRFLFVIRMYLFLENYFYFYFRLS